MNGGSLLRGARAESPGFKRRSLLALLLFTLLSAFSLGSAEVLLAGSASAPGAPSELSFERLNRTYEGFIEELAPIELGPARVLLTSPTHSLTVITHRAVLSPSPAGGHDVALELRFLGQGTINAQVFLGGVESRLQDELVVPEQEIQVLARVAIERTSEGFSIQTLELPPSVTVRIESRLASRLFSICRPMSLVLVGLDCDLLERSLTFLEAPLPPAGTSYLLPDVELSEQDQKRFLGYLESTRTARATPSTAASSLVGQRAQR